MILSRLRQKQHVIVSVLIALFLFAGTGVVYASGDGAAAEKHWVKEDTYKVMNFTVLAVVLFLLLRKPVPEFLNARIKGIRDQLAELEDKKRAAEKTLSEYDEKISQLSGEADKILAQYAEQAEIAKKKLQEEAEASAAKLEEQAKRNIEHEFMAAKRKLRDEVIDEAIVRAEELVKKSVGADDQKKLVDEYLEKVVA